MTTRRRRTLYSEAENGFAPKHVGRMSKGRWRLLRTRALITTQVRFLGAAQAAQRSPEPDQPHAFVRRLTWKEPEAPCRCKSQSPKARGPGAPISESRRGWTSRLQERGGLGASSTILSRSGPHWIGRWAPTTTTADLPHTPSTEPNAKLVRERWHGHPLVRPSRHGINPHESTGVSLTPIRVSANRTESPNKDTREVMLPPGKMQPSAYHRKCSDRCPGGEATADGDVRSSPWRPVT